MNISVDLNQSGLAMILHDYEEIALRYLWEQASRDISTREVYDKVCGVLEQGSFERDSISRASIINSLKAMADNGFITYTQVTGKGGYRRLYTAAVSEKKLWEEIEKEISLKIVEVKGE